MDPLSTSNPDHNNSFDEDPSFGVPYRNKLHQHNPHQQQQRQHPQHAQDRHEQQRHQQAQQDNENRVHEAATRRHQEQTRPQQQQHQKKPQRQQHTLHQHQPQGDENNQHEHHAQHQQNHPSHQKQPQWRSGQTQTGAPSRRRGRRQQKQGPQEFKVNQTPTSHAALRDDDMVPLVEATFDSDNQMPSSVANLEQRSTRDLNTQDPVLSRSPATPERQDTETSPSREGVDEEEEKDEDERQGQETDISEEDQMLSDRELQQTSRVELENIEANLVELSKELDQIVAGEIPNKRRVLLTEENLTKAMLRIDAVESGGDVSIRQKRKALINWAEQLLTTVDDFKRCTRTSVYTK
ncbi:hypothetical protein EDD11_000059 [Mortierella claussenii]|nr:hypothetical protein EDD11_000059 [Mortierella claussenii]